jgi:hypothetical protein
MKWPFIIREKIKIALLLGTIMLLVGFTTVMEKRNIESISKSFSSIYHDRLIPATDIFYLTENLYTKRLLMENFLYAGGAMPVEELRKQLAERSAAIDKLIAKFEKTLLVENESVSLQAFKQRAEHYKKVEVNILDNVTRESRESAQHLYETEGRDDLRHTIQRLEELTKIQSSVGLSLIDDSKDVISSSQVVLTLQIAMAIVIGLLVQALILASKVVNIDNKNFNLN